MPHKARRVVIGRVGTTIANALDLWHRRVGMIEPYCIGRVSPSRSVPVVVEYHGRGIRNATLTIYRPLIYWCYELRQI